LTARCGAHGAVARAGPIVTLRAATLVGGPNTLEVDVTNTAASPITDATVVVTAGSLALDMGAVVAAAIAAASGRYEADVSLDMAGPWQITAQVTHPGGSTALFAFMFELAD
jgi:YtkA-like